MSESIRNRPKIALAIRKDVSLTGEPLCPSCRQPNDPAAKFCGKCGHPMDAPPPPAGEVPTVPPRVVMTKSRHNWGRGNFLDAILRVLIILALLAGAALVVLFIQDHYQAAEGRPETVTPTNAPAFSVACQGLARGALSPIEATTSVRASDAANLRARAAAAGQDRDNQAIARMVTGFADRMEEAFGKREEAKREAARAASAPAATLNPDPAEQQRVREFQQREAGRRWNDFVAAQRESVNRMLVEIEREEQRLKAPRRVEYATPWKKLTRWMGGLFGDASGRERRGGGELVCPACRGQGRGKCEACGGFGTVPAKVEAPCKQCGGTGQYQSRMSHTTVKCPFCSGSGRVMMETRQVCNVCANLGYATCSRCGGTGKVAAGTTLGR